MADAKSAETLIPVFALDGYTYTHEDIKLMRESVIHWRDEAMKQWPESIPFTVEASHIIAVLSHVLKYYPV